MSVLQIIINVIIKVFVIFQFPFFRHGETPSDEQVNAFVEICDAFIRKNPLEIIGMSMLSFCKQGDILQCQ